MKPPKGKKTKKPNKPSAPGSVPGVNSSEAPDTETYGRKAPKPTNKPLVGKNRSVLGD